MVGILWERIGTGATGTVIQDGMEITPKQLFGFGTRQYSGGDGWVRR